MDFFPPNSRLKQRLIAAAEMVGRLVQQYECRRWNQLGLPLGNECLSLRVVHNLRRAKFVERSVIGTEYPDKAARVAGCPGRVGPNQEGGLLLVVSALPSRHTLSSCRPARAIHRWRFEDTRSLISTSLHALSLRQAEVPRGQGHQPPRVEGRYGIREVRRCPGRSLDRSFGTQPS